MSDHTKRRALGVIRLSELTDETSSPVRQRRDIEAKARERGVEIIGWAEDLDVSAFKIPPLNRPKLRRWFDRYAEFDEVIFWKLDRFVRRTFPDWADMLAWSGKRDISLVSATEAMDLTGVMGQWQATNLAFVAQLESTNISLRVASTQAYLRESGRWRGGTPPYGYRPASNPDGPGVVLVVDDDTAAIVREAVNRVIAGESVNAIVADFNRRKLLCPRDYLRALSGKPRRCECGHEKHDGECNETHACTHRAKHANDSCREQVCPEYRERHADWKRESLMAVLRSEAMLGRVIHDDRPLRGKDGMPVERAKPLISPEDWHRLQEVLDRAATVKRRTQTPSALLGVAFCGCGAPLYRSEKKNNQGRVYAYYRCRENYRHPNDDAAFCDAPSIPCSTLDEITHDALLHEIGWHEVMRLEVTPGDGHETELAAVGRQIADLTTERFVKGVVRGDFDSMMASLQAEHARLSALPPSPDVPRYVPTGQTFRQKWEQMNTTERRIWLRDAGVRVAASRNGEWPSAGHREQRAASLGGSLATIVKDIPRWVMEEDGDLRVLIELGSLKDLLKRA